MRKTCIAVALCFLAGSAQAQRVTCTASYDSATGAVTINAVDVGTSRYVVKLDSSSSGGTLKFTLASATATTDKSCYDAASYGTTLTIPDVAVGSQYYNVVLNAVAGSNPLQLTLASASKNPRLIPDAGYRIQKASNPFASVSSAGITYLGYQDRTGGGDKFQSATDGLNFSTPTTLTYDNRSVDSRKTLMPDGKTWRLYQMDPTVGIFTSRVSSDGNVFTAESGTRYSPASADNGSIGVYDHYVAPDGAVVMIYAGDLKGKNNVRMARSTDGGLTFSYLKGNVLGDDEAGGGGNTFIDIKTILLPDGRRRLMSMRANELQSFISSDGYTYARETGTRLIPKDFAAVGLTLYSLNDPVMVFDKSGKLKVYVASSTVANADETPNNTNWVIVSATWQD